MSYVGIGNRQDYIADFPTQSFNGDGSTTTFTLNFEAVTGSVRVAVDNVLQPADGTSYYTNGNSITFTSAPATGTANITVTYLGTVRNVSSVSDGAITTVKLADGAVTNAKLQSGSFTNITDVGTLASGLTLSDNLLFDTASKGVYLGVTSATASNLLDDYEEGTWTASLEDYAGTPTFSDTRYTKIGRMVVLTGRVSLDATSDASDFQINGLPFTVSTSSSNVFGGYPTYSNSAQDRINLLASSNNTVVSVYSANGTQLTYNSFGVNKQLRFILIYFTD
jgi:hypothetical protein